MRRVSRLKQEAPEEQNAQEQDERDDDNLNQTHNRFLMRQGTIITVKQQASGTGSHFSVARLALSTWSS
ncbi:MAG: hypothetical protein H0U54_15930 [Acidobacteria bacterium]|nr:hypothetical protein [Acidobacteriota bacterium]